MPSGDSPEPVRSLAATRTGDVVLIKRILFGTLRSLCTDLGVQEGDVVHCRAGSASHLLLDTASGRTVPIDRDWARFIQVSTPVDLETTARFPAGVDQAAV
jgi:hypothetical protein